MSVHPSFKSGRSKKHKSVLKRLERILRLQKEDKWQEGDSVFGLPKVKVIKLKMKKEKAKAAETEEAAAVGTAAAAGAPVEGSEVKPEVKPETGKKPSEKKGKGKE